MTESPTASRRTFLKSSSAMAAAGAVGQLSLASRAHAAGDETLKVGLIGCGGRGTKAVVQAMSTEGPVKLVAIADAFRDQLDKAVERITKATSKDDAATVDISEDNKFVGFDGYKGVFDADTDVVVIATPPGFRPIHYEYGVEKGKHMFVEKPIATDPAGIRKILAAAKTAKEKNLKIGIGLQRRHRQTYLDLLDQVDDGLVGDLQFMRVYWNNQGVWEPRKSREEVASEMEYQMRNWYYYTWLCGDHIVEQHIHNIDVGNWVMNRRKGFLHPVTARAASGRQVRTAPRYGEIYDHHNVEFTYEDGTKMFSECRHQPNVWNSVSEHLHGTEATLNLTDGNRNTITYPANRKGKEDGPKGKGWRRGSWKGDFNDAYQTEHDKLFAAIRGGEEYDETEYGAHSTMSAIFGRMASYSGKELTWDEALNSDVSLVPEEFGWEVEPPVVPGPDGVYPVPMPGITKVV